MHIGFVTPEYPTPTMPQGGLANYIRKTARHLTERGHDVTIIFIGQARRIWWDDEVLVRELPTPQVHVLLNMPLIWRLSPMLSILSAAWVVRWAVWMLHRLYPFDVLQVSNFRAAGLLLCRNARVPVIARISSHRKLWRTADGQQSQLKHIIPDWLERQQVTQADAVFAPSQRLIDVYAAQDDLPPNQVIRTPLDTLVPAKFDTTFYDENLTDKRYLLFVGQISHRKGVDLIMQILPEMLHYDASIHVVFIGEPRTIEFTELYAAAGTMKNRVLCFEPIPKPMLMPAMQHAVALLAPSRIDNYPNVVLEAQQVGTIVVGTYKSSIDEMIIDGSTGFLVQNDDAKSLLTAIKQVLDTPPTQRQKMQDAIHALVAHIRQEDHIGRLEAFYQEVIKQYHA